MNPDVIPTETRAQVEAILERASILSLALHDEPAPYVIPVSFGCAQGTLYVHGSPRGTKIDLIARDPRVGFSAYADYALVRGPRSCDWGARAVSVVGTGVARVVNDPAEKLRGLDAIMRHYGENLPAYKPESLARTCLIAIDVRSLRGKRLG